MQKFSSKKNISPFFSKILVKIISKNNFCKIHIKIVACLTFVAFAFNPARVFAADAWGVAAQALGVFAAYKSTLIEMLRLGNNAAVQDMTRRQDRAKYGLAPSETDRLLIDRIMERLVPKADFALMNNSLPFMWGVNDSRLFNAACYPTNYISVNRGLIGGLKGDEDEIAAVLAHEMIHGLLQHSAKNFAKAVAEYYGMAFLNMSLGSMDWNKLNALAGYSIAENITLPTEKEADRGGFYLMTAAGFNPGGGAAAMNRMTRYLRYETKDFLEYDGQDKPRQNEYSDHPNTVEREKTLAEMMSDYGVGHAKVLGGKVLLDGELFMVAEATSDAYDNTQENAYYIAGGLSRAFHDYDNIAGWNFRIENGEVDFLTDEPTYRVLKYFVKKRNAAERLRQWVEKAYERENPARREQMRLEESARRSEIMAKKDGDENERLAKEMRVNADRYVDIGDSRRAFMAIERAMASPYQDDIYECYSVRARAKALAGDFDGALKDADYAVAQDGKNLYNFLNRADARRMMGDNAGAINDAQTACEIDEKNAPAWKVLGDVYNDANNREKAMEAYKKLYSLAPDAPIPLRYLKNINPKRAKMLEETRRPKKSEDNRQE